MSNTASKDEDEIPPPERPPSPPPHTTFAARGLHAPTFSAFRPRDIRFSHQQAMNHIAWSCDGRKLAAVGVDKIARVWATEKAVEMRSATTYPGGHSEDIDYVAWNPTHPELFCTSSQKDKRIVFWDGRLNLFDLSSDWICARTITVCDNAINALSFSHDGEFIAIANAGSYIDICATETGMPLHRVPALGPAPTVAWHPSKHVIAYCGQTKIREGGPPPSAWISLFGPGM
ncbi:hypothetical protein GSI_01068 [Ganoderma sinense ZZ0214-1]|uniref:Anaphase-promoting complex subunit 4-like WD40 domain-containing protein n=1 Tax=Ganoderma sinense ZZ0214-1 TaxID=1077348 RepID=A0A2G8SUC7_9APHY|nr:hypothetical protein GSI_01068 [Ganoderma sinense ZZ0214-1]